MSEPEFLHELDVEVEADLELRAAGMPPQGEALVLDPYEAEAEAADLRSLHGAIEALEAAPYPRVDD